MALSECDLIRIRRHEDLDRVERLKLNIDGWTSDDRKSVGEFLRESSYLSKFHRIFYVATPKVACTSVKWWFAGLEGCEDKIRAVVDTKETDADLSVHSAFRIVAPDVTGLVLEDLKEALESDSYFRFALVRNPYRRIFSAWQSKILLREPLQIEPYLKADFFHHPIESSKDIGGAFERFLEFLKSSEQPPRRDYHWASQSDLLRPDLIKYSALEKIEEPDKLSEALAKWLNLRDYTPLQERWSNASLLPYTESFITTRSAELILDLYEQDFDAFGYGREPPTARDDISPLETAMALSSIRMIRARNQRIGHLNCQTEKLSRHFLSQQAEIAKAEQSGVATDGSLGTEGEPMPILSKHNSEPGFAVPTQEHEYSQPNATPTDPDQETSDLSRAITEDDGHIAQPSEKPGVLEHRLARLDSTLTNLEEQVSRLNEGITASIDLLSKISRAVVKEEDSPKPSQNAEVEAIRKSGLFDSSYYVAMYPDIQPIPQDPILHYCERGWQEGRNPSADFDTQAYLATYSDIRKALINPFWHYVIAGRSESRMSRPHHAEKYEDDIRFGELPEGPRVVAYYANYAYQQRSDQPAPGGAQSQLPIPHHSLNGHDCSQARTLEYQAELAHCHGISAFCFSVSPEDNHEPRSPLSTFVSSSSIQIEFLIDVDLRFGGYHETQIELMRRAIADERYLKIDQRPVVVLTVPDDSELLARACSQIDEMLGRKSHLYKVLRCADTSASSSALHRVDSLDAAMIKPVCATAGAAGYFVSDSKSEIVSIPYGVIASQAIESIKKSATSSTRYLPLISVGRIPDSIQCQRPLSYTDWRIEDYRRWIDAAITGAKSRRNKDAPLLFIDAWNDWSRGATLEPDQKTGFSRLNETTRALLGLKSGLVWPKVTVIVPNYNHAAFLPKRLDSIYSQTYKNIEVILLDDCSRDQSREILTSYAKRHPRITRTIFNEQNSGGVFHQWARGIKAATGELIWIAESDDYCETNFLETLVKYFEDEAIMLAYSQSEFVRADETVMPNEFQHYVRTLRCKEKWRHSYVNTAHQEVSEALGIVNTIPNASSAIFRRPVDMPLLNDDEWLSMRVVGDWIFYLHLLRGSKLAFSVDTKNFYRRSEGSAAARNLGTETFYRELGAASRTVLKLYNVPLEVVDRSLERSKELYEHFCGRNFDKFFDLFDKKAILSEREKRTPNVLVSTMGFYPGGAEILPIRIANELKSRGYSVLLLTTGLLGNREDGVRQLLRKDIPVVETSDVEETRKIIHDFGIEILNSHQWHVQNYPSAVRDVFSGLRGHVASLHGMIENNEAFGVTSKQLKTADAFVSTWVYTADKNLGPFVENGLYQKNPAKFIKLPNGMAPPTIRSIRRSDIGIPEDAFVLCCVSRAIVEKGWSETIEAVGRARQSTGRDIRLILVGNGPVYDDFCAAGVPPFVHLAGFNENSVGFYSASDMGIMLTKFKSESFPLTIVDCLFAGKPYIATSVGEIRNMLTTELGIAGEVIDLEDWRVPINQVAAVIAKYAMNPDSLKAFQDMVPAAASRYRIDSLIDQYERVFEKSVIHRRETIAQRVLRKLMNLVTE
jgi:glycosyltransferase involved in cell wall biosynthesis